MSAKLWPDVSGGELGAAGSRQAAIVLHTPQELATRPSVRKLLKKRSSETHPPAPSSRAWPTQNRWFRTVDRQHFDLRSRNCSG